MNNQVPIVTSKVVEENWNFEADRALQVTLAVGGIDKPACNAVVVTDLRTLRFTLYELMTADVTPSKMIIFFLLAGIETLYRPIRPENRHDLCFPHDEQVMKLSQRVLSVYHHSPLVKVIKTRGENTCYCTHFLLLCVGSVLNLATGRLEDALKFRIDDECSISTILVVVEFDLRMLGTWHRKHWSIDMKSSLVQKYLFRARTSFDEKLLRQQT